MKRLEDYMMIACVSRDARFESRIEQSLLQRLDVHVGSRQSQICFCCESRFVEAIQRHPHFSVTMQLVRASR
jgi:hypothetical protein